MNVIRVSRYGRFTVDQYTDVYKAILENVHYHHSDIIVNGKPLNYERIVVHKTTNVSGDVYRNKDNGKYYSCISAMIMDNVVDNKVNVNDTTYYFNVSGNEISAISKKICSLVDSVMGR